MAPHPLRWKQRTAILIRHMTPTALEIDAHLGHATLTVAEILRLDVVQRGRPEVVAGAENLDRPVRWVHISEQPDVAEYLMGGELLLSYLHGTRL